MLGPVVVAELVESSLRVRRQSLLGTCIRSLSEAAARVHRKSALLQRRARTAGAQASHGPLVQVRRCPSRHMAAASVHRGRRKEQMRVRRSLALVVVAVETQLLVALEQVVRVRRVVLEIQLSRMHLAVVVVPAGTVEMAHKRTGRTPGPLAALAASELQTQLLEVLSITAVVAAVEFMEQVVRAAMAGPLERAASVVAGMEPSWGQVQPR